MGAALVLLLVGLGALAAGVLIGRYYVPDDRQLAALVLWVATTNLFNRINAATKQPAGAAW